MNAPLRIGQIVPSSNTTMETEIPEMLLRHGEYFDRRFTFHSSRMRMKNVTAAELEAMDGDSLRCAAELADARVDVMGYACLVAIMSMGLGYHRTSQTKLQKVAADEGCDSPVITSAGALVEGLKDLNVKKVSLIAPYMKPLTQRVVDYLENEGVEVQDARSLEIPNNLDVARHDPANLLSYTQQLDVSGVDAVVLSACVQMRSLPSLEAAQSQLNLPVVSSAACTVRAMLKSLSLEAVVPNAGAALHAA